MVLIDMEMPKDCRKCPFMATDGKELLSPMMCIVLWRQNLGIKHCIADKIRDDCPLKEVPSGKWEQINKNEVNVIPQWKCSECGAEYKCFDMDFEYCPRCGANMD